MGNVSERSELALTAEQKTREKKYWLNKLGGELIRSAFPYEYQKSVENKPQRKTIESGLPGKISQQAIKLSKGADLRLHILFVTAVSLLLDKYTDNRDIIIATPIDKQETQKDLINSVLAIRNQLEDHMTFKQLILQVSQTIFEAVEHQNYPMRILADQLNIPNSDKGFPLFDTAVLLENIHQGEYIRDLSLNMIFSFAKIEEFIDLKVEYNGSYYTEDRVKRLIDHLNRLMEEAFFNLDVPLREINILSDEEKSRQIYTFNATDSEYPVEKTLHRLFAEQAEAAPDQVALIGQIPNPKSQIPNNISITYRELNRKSNGLACILRNRGIKEDTIVGIMMERSMEMPVGILAVLKAGGAFLPIPPGTPGGRKKFILQDCETAALLTQKNLTRENKEVMELFSPHDIFLLDDERIFASETSNWNSNHEIINRPGQLAYIIYTSVSTGKPAGVMVEHSAVINFIYSMYNKFNRDFASKDRCLNLADISLDVSIGELFLPLVFGAAVVQLTDEILSDTQELSKNIIEKAITFAFIPLALLGEVNSYLRDSGPDADGKVALDKVLVGGESIPYGVLAKFQTLNPAMQILNGYGPPEACICAAACKFTPTLDKGMNIPIGKPLPNTRIMVLNRNGKLCPPGSSGELYISGAGLARGYLNNPGLTAEKFINKKFFGGSRGAGVRRTQPIIDCSFIEDVFANSTCTCHLHLPPLAEKSPPGRRRQKIYKTNDLVRWLEDGNLEFIGIKGRQLEIRGYRIEPAEIEYELLKHEKIKEAVVIDRQTGTEDKYLCAYLVYGPGESGKATTAQLVDFLSGQLPAFMFPRYFVPLDLIPLTPHGKVDRKSLPDPQKALGREYVAPASPIEKTIANTWKEILKKDRVGVNDNFFEIGGNSLGILKLKNRLKEELRKDIPDIKFLEYPTIRSFYNYLSREILEAGTGNGGDSQEKTDPYKRDDNGIEKLRLRKKILGNIVDA